MYKKFVKPHYPRSNKRNVFSPSLCQAEKIWIRSRATNFGSTPTARSRLATPAGRCYVGTRARVCAVAAARPTSTWTARTTCSQASVQASCLSVQLAFLFFVGKRAPRHRPTRRPQTSRVSIYIHAAAEAARESLHIYVYYRYIATCD